MLGGYGKYHALECEYNVRIFKDFVDHLPGRTRAIDIGAGIGRVTKTILLAFEDIDLCD